MVPELLTMLGPAWDANVDAEQRVRVLHQATGLHFNVQRETLMRLQRHDAEVIALALSEAVLAGFGGPMIVSVASEPTTQVKVGRALCPNGPRCDRNPDGGGCPVDRCDRLAQAEPAGLSPDLRALAVRFSGSSVAGFGPAHYLVMSDGEPVWCGMALGREDARVGAVRAADDPSTPMGKLDAREVPSNLCPLCSDLMEVLCGG